MMKQSGDQGIYIACKLYNNISGNIKIPLISGDRLANVFGWCQEVDCFAQITPHNKYFTINNNSLEQKTHILHHNIIRNPNYNRPWQHVLEPLSGYLALGTSLYENGDHHGEAYNFGPNMDQNYSVRELIVEMSKYWENVNWTDVSNKKDKLHEAGLLKLNCDKALYDLSWVPALGFSDTVRMTASWYKTYYQDKKRKSMYEYAIRQINEYIDLAKKKKIEWSI